MINATQDSKYENSLEIILNGYNIYNNQSSVAALGFKQSANLQIINETNIVINNTCADVKQGTNTINSGMMQFQIEIILPQSGQQETLMFQYWFICQYQTFNDPSQIKINFDGSMAIIIVFGCICVWFLTKMAKIRSLKIEMDLQKHPFLNRLIAIQAFQLEGQVLYFQGFIVNLILYLFYIVASVMFYVVVHYINAWYETVLIMCLIFALFCCWFLFNELQCFLSVNLKLQAEVFKSIRRCDCISAFLSFFFVVLYLILNQAWYISNIITFCISGSLFRLFKVINLRGVAYLYVGIILFDCIYYFVFLTKLFHVNYEIIVLQYSNYPVLFQIPQFRYNLNKVCVWLSLMDLVVPGISISYLYRFDRNRNSRVYFIIGLLGLFLGIMCWLVGTLTTQNSQIQLPQSIFVYPLIILFTCLWAIRQGDLRTIWYGEFYDKYLMDNFIVEYNPEQSKAELENSALKQDQMTILMKGLKLESQL
ncbi:unnamed protein product (macronuclear) [Paramecium tetraurelia]|uniref:Transmembrane protein n=1 Tax=Paramecium tetraurelia TaxID=5888 RepID=A0DNX4_PARTE|nr:uncharacterized protein GSPATT00018937001 [Paramecium tetraurelia]CAK84741.1 unnamed protein product [Paramecium tetraurelia]|eukprot:XP_001452138.1 hypothetical protein (macronuclear) [Paramecium tetraurelia strain d4-2]